MKQKGRLRMLLIVMGGFILFSILAIYSFGRFAKQVKGESSYALTIQDGQTNLDKALGIEFALHPNESSLLLVPSDKDAFAIRAKSAREAGRSLDLQYYMWHNDLTGQLLGLEVLEAAERGVRVRIILDDMNVKDNSDLLATLNQHPNIHIRMFNPTRARGNNLMRGIEMLLRGLSLDRRMHNKAWIADGRMAIVGGRNIGDEYFGAAENRNFFDVDLLIGGQAVHDTEAIFDDFWNSDAVIPIEALVKNHKQSLEHLRLTIESKRANLLAQPYLNQLADTPSVQSLFKKEWNQGVWQVHWSKDIHVYSDPAIKAFNKGEAQWLKNRIQPIITQSTRRLDIISPYFVPGKSGVHEFIHLHQQGVALRILTNSLAANDVIFAHGGYMTYRKPLLEKGIKLYELKPFGKVGHTLLGSSGASLHTKAFLVDDKLGFVGSFNFDPRSANLNTEMGIIFAEPTIIQALQNEFNLRISNDYSYHVILQDDKLCWLDQSDHHEEIKWQHDPESKWWQRALATVISYLPIESQL